MVSCSECKHAIKDPISLLPDEGWFKARCRVSPKAPSVVNDEIEKFKFCRDMNPNGNCKLFEVK